MDFFTHSPEETFELAYGLGERLNGGETFLLSGDLGAGKTVFAKGIAAGLDIDPADVNSPTFTLVNAHTGRLKLYHLDLYRLPEKAKNESHVFDLGIPDMIEEPGVVMVIEWAERLGAWRIPGARQIVLSDLG
ncbi:MAG: tRNA (adenosine(37)-N6)-threonylcarbamoyltransferase complex ATPase subunit type 1 TsaE, partial [Acidobacteriota bacterium]